MTSKERVYVILKPRHWINGAAIEAEAGDGSLRRVRELRQDGFKIKKRKLANSNAYEYRLVGRA